MKTGSSDRKKRIPRFRFSLLTVFAAATIIGIAFSIVVPALQKMFEHRQLRVPSHFDASTGENVLWKAQVGSVAWGSPVVADGKVFVGSNNAASHNPKYQAKMDLGVLLCFRASDGTFLWQDVNQKLATGRQHDWPLQGVTSTPTVEGDRLWYVTNRAEVVCLDTEGFRDQEDDGMPDGEPHREFSMLEADRVWSFDMMAELGVHPHNASCSGVAVTSDSVFVVTGNGVGPSHVSAVNPNAPSFLALDKHTGRPLWSDASPGENILHGQWGTPTCGILGGVPQVLFPGGDGWLYSFDPGGDGNGQSRLLWKFDCNPKTTKWQNTRRGDRCNLIAAPTIAEGLVYIAVGRDPEIGERAGRLWCIDPTKRGDVSEELVYSRESPDHPIPHRRIQACDVERGEFVRKNLNSAAVWCYKSHDIDADGEIAFEEEMHLALSPVTVRDGVVWAVDFSGIMHCLNAETGAVHWTHDLLANSWSAPVLSDRHVFIADEDGDVVAFPLSPNPLSARPVSESLLPSTTTSTCMIDNNVLYIVARSELLAIGTPNE